MIRSILVGACVLLFLPAPSPAPAAIGRDLADRDVRAAIESEMLGDGIVPFRSIDVTVDDGIVTLDGTVDTSGLDVRRWARDEMRRARTGFQSDDEIREAVKDAFLYDPRVYSFNPDVESSAARYRAGTVANAVAGVVDVENHITVEEPTVWRSDLAIERSIEGELVWNPRVDAGHVDVSVENGIATLTGTVDTWSERSWAGAEARDGGARSVLNELVVREPWTGRSPS